MLSSRRRNIQRRSTTLMKTAPRASRVSPVSNAKLPDVVSRVLGSSLYSAVPAPALVVHDGVWSESMLKKAVVVDYFTVYHVER